MLNSSFADWRKAYSLLGVDPAASDSELAKRYRILAKRYHPDANSGDEQDEEHFKRIAAAFHDIKNWRHELRPGRGRKRMFDDENEPMLIHAHLLFKQVPSSENSPGTMLHAEGVWSADGRWCSTMKASCCEGAPAGSPTDDCTTSGGNLKLPEAADLREHSPQNAALASGAGVCVALEHVSARLCASARRSRMRMCACARTHAHTHTEHTHPHARVSPPWPQVTYAQALACVHR